MTDNSGIKDEERGNRDLTLRLAPELKGPGNESRAVEAEFLADLTSFKTVGRYEILRKLGQGSTGAVYLARDPYIKRDVAVKISHPDSQRARERFFVEAQSAGRLYHPNIVSVHDVGLVGEYCYITMEYVKGPTLEKFCNRGGLLPLFRAVEVIFRVCSALNYAHNRGVVHKDIKPSNILLDKTGAVKVTDFGIAQMTGRTAEQGVFGTPSYMSPEQLKDEVVGNESDIFSLGCVLYEVLTGEQAFSGDNDFSIMYKITEGDPSPILGVRPELPEIFERITKKALAKDLKERYPTCTAFAYDLRVALRGLSGTVKTEEAHDLVDYVHHLVFFQNFKKEQVRELIAATDIRTVRKGEVIVAQGEIDDTFYVLLSGRVRVRKNNEDIARIDAGECFGEMAGIGGQPRFASVVADGDCMFMKFSSTSLDVFPEAIQLLFYKSFAQALVKRISKNTKTDD